MSLKNKTGIRVKIDSDKLIQSAYHWLLRQGEIPYADGKEFESNYAVSWRDPEKREGLFIEFYVTEAKKEEKKPKEEYQAGSWIDPELQEKENVNSDNEA
jgi:hypothetical protein